MKRILTNRMICLFLCVLLLIGNPAANAKASSYTGTANCKVVLRESANRNSKALQTLSSGDEVTIVGETGDWYRVHYGSLTGYIMKQYVNKNGSSNTASDSKSTGKTTTSKTSTAEQIKAIGSAPGIMRPGDDNSDVKKLQKALQILGYYDGKIDGDYGSGTQKAVTEYQKDHHLTADGSAGEKTVTAIFGSCSKKSLTTQPAAGSSKSDTKSSGSSKTSKYKTVNSISEIGTAPSPTKKGDSGTNVVKLQQALECLGYYSGNIDGNYGDNTVAAVKKLQQKRGMKVDGVAGESTIRVLFGTTAKSSTKSSTTSTTKYKTEVKDWFKDNMTRVIPKNARFTVKDVRTGRTFECVRWSGANHLDAEPRTSTDTATMKKIYGGSWSWKRRPILVKYNGHVYAASMNGMPHGTSTISGNGFDGHFCIHFKNSKTHETKVVDAEHQRCVNEASKASW